HDVGDASEGAVLSSAGREGHRPGLDRGVQAKALYRVPVTLVNGDEVAAGVSVEQDAGRGGQHARISLAVDRSGLRDLPHDFPGLDIERAQISRRRVHARTLACPAARRQSDVALLRGLN